MRSPAWIKTSPLGSLTALLWVSLMHTMRVRRVARVAGGAEEDMAVSVSRFLMRDL